MITVRKTEVEHIRMESVWKTTEQSRTEQSSLAQHRTLQNETGTMVPGHREETNYD